MKTALIIGLSKVGLIIARQVVKLTPSKKDDALLEIIDCVYKIISRVKGGDFDVEKEVNRIGELVVVLRPGEGAVADES